MEEDNFIPISALQHWAYCPRQCALIHVEQAWQENVHTLRGRAVHTVVDGADGGVIRRGVRIERSLPVWSERLQIRGKIDLVEFHGRIPFPIDYKHGPRKSGRHDDVQVCAYALCLEEMLEIEVPQGAIFHYSSRRRREITFNQGLREMTMQAIDAVRELLRLSRMPPPVNDSRCQACSLIDTCMPTVINDSARLEQVRRTLWEVL